MNKPAKPTKMWAVIDTDGKMYAAFSNRNDASDSWFYQATDMLVPVLVTPIKIRRK